LIIRPGSVREETCGELWSLLAPAGEGPFDEAEDPSGGAKDIA
jgi:hypothetical protein